MGGLKPEVHDLKCWPRYFGDIANGTKAFEVRTNDRDYAVDDYLLLREWNEDGKRYKGPVAMVRVVSLLTGAMLPNLPGHQALPLIPPGVVVMGIRLLDPPVTNWEARWD